MTIKTKLLGSSLLNTAFLLCVLGAFLFVFHTIDTGANKIKQQADESRNTSQQATNATEKADGMLADILVTSESVSREVVLVNNQMQILQRKIKASAQSLSSVSALVEETIDSLGDDPTAEALFDVADEISDLQDMMKTEAMVSLGVSVEGMTSSSQDLVEQVSLLAEVSHKLETAKDLNITSTAAAQEIDTVSTSFQGSIAKARNILAGLIVTIAALTFFLTFRIAQGIISPLKRGVSFAQNMATGDLTQEVNVDAQDEIGDLARALNEMSANLRTVIQNVASSAQNVSSASENLTRTSTKMSGEAEGMSTQSGNVTGEVENLASNLSTVASGADTMSESVSTVAAAVEEMNASLTEVSKSCAHASRIAGQADSQAQATGKTMEVLNNSATKIDTVLDAIADIADQTNLLALNATIEAASAGDAGKGFAVVANEVKELANQTAMATDQISLLIAEMQTNASGAVGAIENISEVVSKINETNLTISTAVEEQSATIGEIAASMGGASQSATAIARNVQEASAGSAKISTNIHNVNQSSQETATGAIQINGSAEELAEMSHQLQELMGQFKTV